MAAKPDLIELADSIPPTPHVARQVERRAVAAEIIIEWMRERLVELEGIDTPSTTAGLVGITGMPGSGKSNLEERVAEKFEEVGKEFGASLIRIPMDWGLVARSERSAESIESYMRLDELRGFIKAVLAADGKSTSIPLDQYQRKPGKRGDGEIKQVKIGIPERPRVILVEGVGATNLLNSMKKDRRETPLYRVHMVMRYADAVFRGALRGYIEGRRSFEEGYAMYTKEIENLGPFVEAGAEPTDLRVWRTTDMEKYWSRLLSYREEDPEIFKKVMQLLCKLDKDNILKKVFPKGYLPKKKQRRAIFEKAGVVT